MQKYKWRATELCQLFYFFLYKVLDKNNIHLISFLFPIAVFSPIGQKMMGGKACNISIFFYYKLDQ